MFDNLICEPDLPDGWRPKSGRFQTKDFDCELVTYTITRDGRLLGERVTNLEVVPREERPFPDAAPGTFQSICGILRRETVQEELGFEGTIRFYELEVTGYKAHTKIPGVQIPEGCRMHEYLARFENGRLVEITGGVLPEDEPSKA